MSMMLLLMLREKKSFYLNDDKYEVASSLVPLLSLVSSFLYLRFFLLTTNCSHLSYIIVIPTHPFNLLFIIRSSLSLYIVIPVVEDESNAILYFFPISILTLNESNRIVFQWME